MNEAGFEVTQSAMGDQSNRFQGDEKLFVKFYTHPQMNQKKSTSAGRPIYEDTAYVTIMVPGDKTSIVTRPARQQDKDRFAKQFSAFTNNEGEHVEGTPLEAWPGITRSQVEEMRFFNIRTVEQLATLSDAHTGKFMGMNTMKTRAQAFLDAAKGNAANEKMVAELESRDNEILSLKQGMAELSKTVAKMNAAPAAEEEPEPEVKANKKPPKAK